MIRRIHKKKVIRALSRHKEVDDKFLEEVKTLSKEILENIGNPIAKKAVRMSREVDTDLHSHKAFLRLSVSPHGILYASSKKLVHHNEKPFLYFLKKRFPLFIILFESNRGVFIIDNSNRIKMTKKELNYVLKEYESRMPLNPLLQNLTDGNFHELWESFALSQLIQGKKESSSILNLSKKWDTKVTMKRSNSKLLDDFLVNKK
ncbi:DUF4130 domain-containing protein [Candidatus Hodarchaeum mangrovi]